MNALPTEWTALLAVVFMLGLRHGIDADHIATIDALTRLAAGRGRRLARWSGALFALGHGTAVLALVGAMALASQRSQPPEWLAPVGAWISITLLVALGLANLRAALGATPGQVVALRGLRGRLFERLLGSGHPAAAVGIGVLFAASFDTVGLAVMFALSGTAAGMPTHALLLGALFAAGMLVTDAANGWWLARLLARAGGSTARASRLTAGVVGGISLAVAALGGARWASPAADAWAEGRLGWLGGALALVTVGISGLLLWRAEARHGFRPASKHTALS